MSTLRLSFALVVAVLTAGSPVHAASQAKLVSTAMSFGDAVYGHCLPLILGIGF